MGKCEERDFEALDYAGFDGKTKAKLTCKQYLVYSYLMSISKWSPKDIYNNTHYYVYKSSFKINDACNMLDITAPTWRNAIKKLIKEGYIRDRDKYYTIKITDSFAPLNINLIKKLIDYGTQIEHGGWIVSLYSVLYKYLYYQNKCGYKCEVTISQLTKLFSNNPSLQMRRSVELMLALYQFWGLIDMQPIEREYYDNSYVGYIIKNVRLDLPNKFKDDSKVKEPDDISQIIEAL